MISGIGMDIVEIGRIASLLERQPRFALRVLTPLELERFEGLSERRRVEFLAGRFAVKEAFAKAKGSGIGHELSFLDIEVLNDKRGAPFLQYRGKKEQEELKVHVSITHSRDYAAAQVILESLSS
ncbi:holo-ACP synthase [Bacillus lacus]|uniref:Holo-[acyl-carrier-protein] synthase n=1 Tax=Metabacillus lacus TaxID=1983721 RepID=A0A7X2IYE2_9BACI|nr:holo-ACP synthase [Metabacillus lacus]MRX72093.1 holo-ACP synthase [Metabacillus lacus]